MLALCENLVKQTIVVRDSVLNECIQFLQQCEQHGRDVKASVDGPLMAENDTSDDRNSVMYEARMLRALLLQIMQS